MEAGDCISTGRRRWQPDQGGGGGGWEILRVKPEDNQISEERGRQDAIVKVRDPGALFGQTGQGKPLGQVLKRKKEPPTGT